MACDRLDGIPEYGIWEGDATGLLVLHGLAMYAKDTARAASSLLRDGHTLAAGALARVVIEHAVLAQWLKVDPEARGQLFTRQSEVERARWFDVVLGAYVDQKDPAQVALTQIERDRGLLPSKPKNVATEFDTVRNLFADTEKGRQWYLTYRNLSRFVHPSSVTFMRYARKLPGGADLKTELQVEQDPEAVAYYLASALAVCALTYFDVLGEVEAGAVVGVAARTADVSTTLN